MSTPISFEGASTKLRAVGYTLQESDPGYSRNYQKGQTMVRLYFGGPEIVIWEIDERRRNLGIIVERGPLTLENLNFALTVPAKLVDLLVGYTYCDQGQITKDEKEDEFGVICKNEPSKGIKLGRKIYYLCSKHLDKYTSKEEGAV